MRKEPLVLFVGIFALMFLMASSIAGFNGYLRHINETYKSSVPIDLQNFPFYTEFDTATQISEVQMRSDCADLELVNESNSLRRFDYENHANSVYGCNKPRTAFWQLLTPFRTANTSETSYYFDQNSNTTFENNTVFRNYRTAWHLADKRDSSGQGRDLIIDSSVQTISNDSCIFGACQLVPPKDKPIVALSNNTAFGSTGDFILEFWYSMPVVSTNPANDSAVLSQWGTETGCLNSKNFEILYQGSVPRYFVSACTNVNVNPNPSFTVSDQPKANTPVYIVLGFDDANNRINFYINGTLRQSIVMDASSTGIHGSDKNLTIGSNSDSDSGGLLSFYVDEVRVANFNASAEYVYQNWVMGCSRRGLDGCGENITAFGPEQFVNDTTPPVFSNFKTNPISPFIQLDSVSPLSVQFNVTVVDDMSVGSVILNLSGSNFTPSQSNSEYFTSQNVNCGLTNYNWIAVDTSGNQNISQSFTFNLTCITTSSPTITNVTTNPSSPFTQTDTTADKSVIFYATVTDDFGAIGTVLFTLNGVDFAPSNVSSLYVTTQDTQCGANSYAWFANDTGGNNNSQSASFVLNCVSTLGSTITGSIVVVIGIFIALAGITIAGLGLIQRRFDIQTAFIIIIFSIVFAGIIIGINSSVI